MSKKQQTQKAEYSEYDLIERGTFLIAHHEFWDKLYEEFPHLTLKHVIPFTGYILTNEEWSNICQKDKKYLEYGYFTPETLSSQRIYNIDRSNLKNIVYNMREVEHFSNSNMDGIIEIRHVGEELAELRWFLLDRSFSCTPETSGSNSMENPS